MGRLTLVSIDLTLGYPMSNQYTIHMVKKYNIVPVTDQRRTNIEHFMYNDRSDRQVFN